MSRQRFKLIISLLLCGWAHTAFAQLLNSSSVSVPRLSSTGFPKVEPLQSIIDRPGQFIYVPAGEYLLDAPLMLRSDLNLVFEPGTRVVAAQGAFRGIEDCLMVIAGLENVTIQAADCTFIMRKDDYRNPALYKASEWRHAVTIRGSRKITLRGGRFESSGGDGIYIGPLVSSAGRKPCEEVRILDVTCHNNLRQGISVVAGRDLFIANSLFSGTNGRSPQAGIDVEPEYGDSVDVVVNNCNSKGNRGPAYMVNLAKVTPARGIRIVFQDCIYSAVPPDQLNFRPVSVFNERGRLDDHLPSGARLEWNGLIWTKP